MAIHVRPSTLQETAKQGLPVLVGDNLMVHVLAIVMGTGNESPANRSSSPLLSRMQRTVSTAVTSRPLRAQHRRQLCRLAKVQPITTDRAIQRPPSLQFHSRRSASPPLLPPSKAITTHRKLDRSHRILVFMVTAVSSLLQGFDRSYKRCRVQLLAKRCNICILLPF